MNASAYCSGYDDGSKINLNKQINGNDLYQIGLPVASLSTVLMDWTCFNRPEKLLISPAKKDEWAVVELRNPELAAAIIKDVPEAMVKVVQQPVKVVQI